MRRERPTTVSRSWTPNLDHFSRYSHFQDCLAMIWQNAGAAGVDPEELLLPYQRDIFRDLEDGVDESVLAKLYDWWDYDFEVLYGRASKWRPEVAAKPRIRLWMEVSSKGNFKCEWWPVGLDNFGYREPGETPDWRSWYRLENRRAGWDSRPTNELIFIHSVDHALGTVRFPDHDDRPIVQLDFVLLQGIAELISELKGRLERHFEVTMLRDVFVTWDPKRQGIWEPDRMLNWEIDDPERRQNEAEMAELGSIKQRLGFTETHFEELWAACAQKKRSGPAPTPQNISPKVAKLLREEGLREITARETNRVRFLIDKHRPKRRHETAEVIAFPQST
jgi:hypothetical protein